MATLSEGHSAQERATAYEHWYAKGGWRATRPKQRTFMTKVAKTAGWNPGARILELGCGMGLQASCLAELGIDVVAVDASETGIAYARDNFAGPEYIRADLENWEPEEEFDGIYCRGMSMYHYELDGVNLHGYDVPKETARFFEWTPDGGTFVLQIATRFSGERPEGWVHHPRLSEYLALFSPLGNVVSATDWNHRRMVDDAQAQRSGQGGIVIYTQKG